MYFRVSLRRRCRADTKKASTSALAAIRTPAVTPISNSISVAAQRIPLQLQSTTPVLYVFLRVRCRGCCCNNKQLYTSWAAVRKMWQFTLDDNSINSTFHITQQRCKPPPHAICFDAALSTKMARKSDCKLQVSFRTSQLSSSTPVLDLDSWFLQHYITSWNPLHYLAKTHTWTHD